jgi:hypothetical protein
MRQTRIFTNPEVKAHMISLKYCSVYSSCWVLV